MAKPLKRENVAHVIRAVSSISNCTHFVVVGAAALLLQPKPIPVELTRTRDIDIYAEDADDEAAFASDISSQIGSGSKFDALFGYYPDGVDSRTADMPSDWQDRHGTFAIPDRPEITVKFPSANDLALAKLVSWRDKDKDWLVTCARHALINLTVMKALSDGIISERKPSAEELARRFQYVDRGAWPNRVEGRNR